MKTIFEFKSVVVFLTLFGFFSTVDAAAQTVAPQSDTIDRKSCTMELANEQEIFKQFLIKQAREAQGAGLKPAISFEPSRRAAKPSTAQAGVDVRANDQASKLSKALFAALETPNSVADAASLAMNESASRRSGLQLYSKCQGANAPQLVVENMNHSNTTECPGGANPSGVGMNIREVFQSSLSPQQLKSRFMAWKLSSTEDSKIKICTGGVRVCASGANYQTAMQLPQVRGDIYVQQEKSYSSFMSPEVNRMAMKSSTTKICGSDVTVVTGFNLNSQYGFDHSSYMAVIGRIGSKSVLLTEFSGQTSNPESYPAKAPAYYNKAQEKIFESYSLLAQKLGSPDRTVSGEVQSAEGKAPRSTNRSTQTYGANGFTNQ
jgi:hypothetical protein